MRMKNKKKLSKKEIAKRQKAANDLYGIWTNLPKYAIKELMKKTY
jgi:hypothetical protein